MKKIILLAFIAITSLQGCSFNPIVIEKGSPIKFTEINDKNIIKGITTKENIINLLGEPYSVTEVGGYNEIILYKHDIITKPAYDFMGRKIVMENKSTRKTSYFRVVIEKGFVSHYKFVDKPVRAL